MSLVNSLLSFLQKTSAETNNNAVPEGFCPNCWGREEYGGQFFEAVKNHRTDINSIDPRVGWIQDYADKHLSGIQLKQESDHFVCPKCKVTYRPLQ
jgi:hypothetical protein